MRYFFLIIIIAANISVQAQPYLPTPRNIQAAYDKGTRSPDGSPGLRYWQNTADYRIDVQFYPDTRLITGSVDIVYYNNSPDTLRQVWFKLYPNLYQQGAPRDRSIGASDIGEGLIIDQLVINGKLAGPASVRTDATNMQVRVPALAKGEKMVFSIRYHYTLNKGSHIRTGEIAPGAAFIAYFFPRIAVYDDIDGWNKLPYTGSLEFYNDFCRFDVSITVPTGFLVWATGDLLNAEEMLPANCYQRLLKAESADGTVTIIDTSDLQSGIFIKTGQPRQTWQYAARNVTDFVFAVSDHYIWRSTSLIVDPSTGRRTRVDAVFDPKHADYYPVIADARKTVEAMSYRFPAWPFPYSHITVVDGLDQMEYPMMVNDNPVEDRHESIELTDHEIFHTMFPFYMGINETKYPWMDEGWATLGEWLISPMIDSTVIDEYGVLPYALSAGTEFDITVMASGSFPSKGGFINAYPKPAMGYLYVRDYLGEELFTRALHHYIRTWQGRHPVPNDFFYSMNKGAGRNLNWFWKKWFYEDGIPDLAIESVSGNTGRVTVTVAAKGSKPVPVDLTVHYTDGSKEAFHQTIGVWEKGAAKTRISFNTRKRIEKLVLGHPHTPDSNPADNTYIIK